jgi:hypothetical protein
MLSFDKLRMTNLPEFILQKRRAGRQDKNACNNLDDRFPCKRNIWTISGTGDAIF